VKDSQNQNSRNGHERRHHGGPQSPPPPSRARHDDRVMSTHSQLNPSQRRRAMTELKRKRLHLRNLTSQLEGAFGDARENLMQQVDRLEQQIHLLAQLLEGSQGQSNDRRDSHSKPIDLNGQEGIHRDHVHQNKDRDRVMNSEPAAPPRRRPEDDRPNPTTMNKERSAPPSPPHRDRPQLQERRQQRRANHGKQPSKIVHAQEMPIVPSNIVDPSSNPSQDGSCPIENIPGTRVVGSKSDPVPKQPNNWVEPFQQPERPDQGPTNGQQHQQRQQPFHMMNPSSQNKETVRNPLLGFSEARNVVGHRKGKALFSEPKPPLQPAPTTLDGTQQSKNAIAQKKDRDDRRAKRRQERFQQVEHAISEAQDAAKRASPSRNHPRHNRDQRGYKERINKQEGNDQIIGNGKKILENDRRAESNEEVRLTPREMRDQKNRPHSHDQPPAPVVLGEKRTNEIPQRRPTTKPITTELNTGRSSTSSRFNMISGAWG